MEVKTKNTDFRIVNENQLVFNGKPIEIKANIVKLFFKEYGGSEIYFVHELNGKNFLSHWISNGTNEYGLRIVSGKKALIVSDNKIENKLVEYAYDFASGKEVKEFLDDVGKFLKIHYETIFHYTGSDYERSEKEKFLLKTYKQLKNDFNIYINQNTNELCIYDEIEGIYKVYDEKMFSFFLKNNIKTEFFENEVKIIIGLFNEIREESEEYMAFQNCYVNLKTLETKPFTPEIFTTFKIPFIWDSTAYSEFFESKLMEILDDTKILKFLQMVGYCFFKGNPHNKLFLLIGDGANGKSTLISIIKSIFKYSIVAVPLQDFSKEFGLQPLIDKRINLLYDLPIETIYETGQIKAITGEDTITINRKYKDPITTKLNCKIIGSGNNLPKIKDDSFAFWRRIIILNLNKRFEGKERDVKLKEKMINDCNGMAWLIYRSINEYKEIEEIGWQEDTHKIVRETFLKDSDPALLAAENIFKITIEPDDFLSRNDVKNQINNFLSENNLRKPMKVDEYYKAVKEIGSKVGQATVEGNKVHGFRYIKINHQ